MTFVHSSLSLLLLLLLLWALRDRLRRRRLDTDLLCAFLRLWQDTQELCRLTVNSRTDAGPRVYKPDLKQTSRAPYRGLSLAHTVSLACCDHPHRSFCQFRRTNWTPLLVVSLLLLRDSGTLFHWTVELLNPLTHLRSVLRHFSLIRHNRTVARASVLWRDINWLIDWLIMVCILT